MSEDVILRDRLPEPSEYLALLRLTGWLSEDELLGLNVVELLRGTWWGVTASCDGRAVGMGRVISDGSLYALVVDVIVHPDYRRRGIGFEVVRRSVARCKTAGLPYIQLFAARGTQAFYEALGFAARSTDAPGMQLPRPDRE